MLSSSATGVPHDFGPQLEPALQQACGGKLHDIRWFRTDWQHGGAATAIGAYECVPGEPPREVVIKLPVGPKEYRFAVGLNATDAPTPRIAAHGLEIGGWDLAWLVMERLPGTPLAAHLHKEVFDALTHAAAGFYRHACATWPVPAPSESFPYEELIHRSREQAKAGGVPESQSWTHTLHDVQKHLPSLLLKWRARPINAWCHGDLHAGNAMRRPEDSPWGKPGCVLFDFAEVHPGHWVEDAIYLERMYWGKPEALAEIKPVSLMARARRSEGLDTSGDYAMIANIRRVLMASCAPAFARHDGHPRYMHGALEILHKFMPQVLK